jgi:hypothetical protein
MPAAEDRTMLEELADRLGLEDDDRNGFVNDGMKRMGYKPRVDWDEPDQDDGKGGDSGGDFFTRRRGQQQRQSRDVSGGRQRPDDRGRRTSGGYEY